MGHFEFSKDRSIIDYKLSNRIKFELSLGQSSRKKLGGQKKKMDTHKVSKTPGDYSPIPLAEPTNNNNKRRRKKKKNTFFFLFCFCVQPVMEMVDP